MHTMDTGFQHLSVTELNERLSTEPNICIVDIRDPNAFSGGRIPQSIHLSNDNLTDFIREADLDAPLVVCCYHGNASQQAAAYLSSQDFTQVYSLDGGFEHWRQLFPEQVELA